MMCLVMEVQLVQSVESTESAEKSAKMIDVSENLVELLTLTINVVINETKNQFLTQPGQVVREIEANMNKYFHNIEKLREGKPDDSTFLAQAYLQMSTLYHNHNYKKEKLYIAEAYLARCLRLLKGKELDRKIILIVVTAYLELGYLWFKLKNLKKSKAQLDEIVELYKMYTQGKDDYPAPVCILAIVGLKTKNNLIDLDKLYWQALCTLTLLASKGITSEVEKQNVMMYMHKLLTKQLKGLPSTIGRVEWAINVQYLAKLFLEYDRFAEAKNHIITATFVMRQFYNEELNVQFPDMTVGLSEQYNYGVSRNSMCWAWYGVALLAASTKQTLIQNNTEDKLHGASDLQSKQNPRTESVIQLTKLLFANSGEEVPEFGVLDRDTRITNYHDAVQVFQNILNNLNKVRLYFINNSDLELYMEYIRCTSKAYKYLMYYEKDRNKKIELQQKHATALTDIMGSLRPTDNQYLRGYVSLELAIAISTQLDTRIENFPIEGDLINSSEIKELVNLNIENLKLYLQHFTI